MEAKNNSLQSPEVFDKQNISDQTANVSPNHSPRVEGEEEPPLINLDFEEIPSTENLGPDENVQEITAEVSVLNINGTSSVRINPIELLQDLIWSFPSYSESRLLVAVECVASGVKSKEINQGKDLTRDTLLHLLCASNKLECIQILLSNTCVLIDSLNGLLQTPLMLAAIQGNVEIAIALIRRGASLKCRDDVGRNFLDYAVSRGGLNFLVQLFGVLGPQKIEITSIKCAIEHGIDEVLNMEDGSRFELVKFLLCHGYSINITDEVGDTVQTIFCRNSWRRLVYLTIELGANPSIINDYEETALSLSTNREWWSPLHSSMNKWKISIPDPIVVAPVFISSLPGLSLRQLHRECRKGLVSSSGLLASIENIDELEVLLDGTGPQETCLYAASSSGNLEMVNCLLGRGADPNIVADNGDNNSSLIAAVKGGFYDLARQLIAAGANVNQTDKQGATALHFAVLSSRFDLFTLLLSNGANIHGAPNTDTPLLFACRFGIERMVEALLQHGANVNVMKPGGWAPISAAAFAGFVKIADILFSAFPPPDLHIPQTCPVVCAACESSNEELLRRFLLSGADPNLSCEGNTPMHILAKSNQGTLLQLLESNGAIVDASNNDGDTPFLLACQAGNLCAVEVLRALGAAVNVCNHNCVSPLHAAAGNNHHHIVGKLISYGTDINYRTNEGATPLFLAALNGCFECSKILVDNQADFTLETKNGQTAADVASINRHYRTLQLLMDCGAVLNVNSQLSSRIGAYNNSATPYKRLEEQRPGKRPAAIQSADESASHGLCNYCGSPSSVAYSCFHDFCFECGDKVRCPKCLAPK